MSHHSDDNMLIATSDSFWEPGNYKRTTKRIEDGHKLCDSLIALVQERAEIEKSYAKALKNWSKNWNDKIEKGPEYGTTEAAWKGVLVEADRLCDLHLRVKEDLCNDIIQKVKTWQKDNYHKVRTIFHSILCSPPSDMIFVRNYVHLLNKKRLLFNAQVMTYTLETNGSVLIL